MSRVRVHNFSISLDGFGTGEPQSQDAPFGHAGRDCTSGCSRRGGGGNPTSRGVAAVSTTSSPASMVRGSAPRSWAPGSSDLRDGTRTRLNGYDSQGGIQCSKVVGVRRRNLLSGPPGTDHHVRVDDVRSPARPKQPTHACGIDAV